jgi:Gram-negative bacterial TonB protein C-terminal
VGLWDAWYIDAVLIVHLRRVFVTALVAGCFLAASAAVPPEQDDFSAALEHAAKLSTLGESGMKPFHVKLTTQDLTLHNPDYTASIEIWWAAPDRWRRSVKSPKFSQLAVRNGDKYLESSAADEYLPYWVQELLDAVLTPVPPDFASKAADPGRPGCYEWEDFHATGAEGFSTHDEVCFYPDGTLAHIFAEPLGIEFKQYGNLDSRRVATVVTVLPGDRSDATASMTTMEPLEKWQPSADDPPTSQLFEVTRDTGWASRVRFVSVPDSELVPAETPPRPPMTWPSTYTFPVDGVIAMTAHIDRQGNIRQIPFTISKNQRLNEDAAEQVKSWKFKPYIVEGSPVEVVTTLLVPFHLKYEPLGANGKDFPPISFGEHIAKYHELSDPRAEGGEPFHMSATLTFGGGLQGKYEEIWQAPGHWTKEVDFQGGVLRQSQSGAVPTEKFSGETRWEGDMAAVIAALQDGLPDPRTFQEADWGNSAVPEKNIFPNEPPDGGDPVLIRAARGDVDSNNHPTSGQAYWFDAEGLLRATFENGLTVVNSNYALWKDKKVARTVEIFSGPLPAAIITIDTIEAPSNQRPLS